MTCERYRDTLRDRAAGAAAPAGVEAHLATCSACRAELAALRQALAVADDEMARLVLVEPSPELAARIRTAVAESAEAEPGWRLGWGLVVGAAVAAALIATVFVAQRGSQPRPAVMATDARPGSAHETPSAAPTTDLVAGSRPRPVERSSEVVSPVADLTPTTRKSRTPRTQQAAEPEVLVPAGEAEALLRFSATLRSRSVAPDSLLVADLSSPLVEPKDVEIRPLVIVPLDPASSSGVD